MASNKATGNDFEAELCDLLANNKFWAHNMAQNQTGQPADVIAVKKDIAYLIDCKVCQNDRFSFSRIEPNQEAAMTLWEQRGNVNCYFALKDSRGEIFMLHFDEIQIRQMDGQTGITDFTELQTFKEWLEEQKCFAK